MKIQVILGSTRPNRKSEIVGKWVLSQISENEQAEIELIDLRDWPLPFYNEVSGVMGLKGNYSVELAKKWAGKIGEADGYIMIVPEYNHGYPAVLKNALDYVYFEWNKKAVSFVSYGGVAAGARAVQQLKQVTVELQMVPLREAVHIPLIWQAIDESGNLKVTDSLNEELKKLFDQLLWYTKALKDARENA